MATLTLAIARGDRTSYPRSAKARSEPENKYRSKKVKTKASKLIIFASRKALFVLNLLCARVIAIRLNIVPRAKDQLRQFKRKL